MSRQQSSASEFFRGAGATPEPWNGERKLSFPGKLPTEAAVYGEALSEEELRAMFDKFDVNKNGVLDRDEFITWYREHREHFGLDPEEDIDKMYSNFNLAADETISYEKFCVIMLSKTRL
jgi:Ca2+-binding EF-hand superfamily protein|eukprot:CAMPEP_0174282998 /NCGR_PEP_ID=MMETSP0809-20121228/3589_1 /TAXON_ID=73025 ORGANISM="Eutreptiella gymnastica-like, Strain CCMP1594" /NCGR_SAMPLE_ID=MMETSP0809 /ASSEMBLY_ACC=CAM_ASM_000658 /LENGTH=119 /DNA_ID=CAMNT_0015377583 /DNA_START=24 /DNA_END=383 /DNA_ORIENTATION=-